MRWRRHSCLPPRHSCRSLALAKTPAGVETSLDAARKSACAAKIVEPSWREMHREPIEDGNDGG